MRSDVDRAEALAPAGVAVRGQRGGLQCAKLLAAFQQFFASTRNTGWSDEVGVSSRARNHLTIPSSSV